MLAFIRDGVIVAADGTVAAAASAEAEAAVVREMRWECVVCRRKMPDSINRVCGFCSDHACAGCGELDEAKLRNNLSRSTRGCMECYKCYPERPDERLAREFPEHAAGQSFAPLLKRLFDELDKLRGKDGWRRE